MNRTANLVMVFALSLCAASAALGQTAALVDDPEADILPEVLVLAKAPGPAWWRVSRGESVVWIMGSPAAPLPKGMNWDRKTLDRRLTGAQALLTPPAIFLTFPAGAEASALEMPPPLAERFAKVRTQIKKPARRYAGRSPSAASFALYRDYLQTLKLEHGTALRWGSAMAKTRKVPVIRPAALRAGRLTLAQTDAALPAAAACYNALLEAAEAPVARYRAAAAGWARGDLAAALSAPRHPYSICDNRLFNEGGSRRAIDVQVAAIRQALAKPGKTVAIVELRILLAEEGVLARLKREGYSVVSPNEPESLD